VQTSVTGIPLGDGCIVDAGIAILAGTKIKIDSEELVKIKEATLKLLLKIKRYLKVKSLQA